MVEKTFCTVRKDLVEEGLSVPVGDDTYIESGKYEYRWVGEDFEILIGDKWLFADSIDFDF
jgi:hypothetical protein